MSADLAALCAELRLLHGEYLRLVADEPDDVDEQACAWDRLADALEPRLPTLLDAAERLGRLECLVKSHGNPLVRRTLFGQPVPPCHHERKLAEYKAAVEPILCDAAESADPTGLLRAADMVPAQELRDEAAGLDQAAAFADPDDRYRFAAERLRALLPENQERTSPAPKASQTLFECQCCYRTTWGLSDGSTDEDGWRWIARMDGPNAICPACAATPDASLATIREDWPDAYVAVARHQERTP